MRTFAVLLVAILALASCTGTGSLETTTSLDETTTTLENPPSSDRASTTATSPPATPETTSTTEETTTTTEAQATTTTATPSTNAAPTTTLPSGAASATCVNGWITPTPGTALRTDPLDMIRGSLGLGAGDLFVVDDMRYFVGPEDVEVMAPRRDVEHWYVKASLQADPAVAGRWMVRRINIGQGVAYTADYTSTGYEPGTWVGYEGEGAEYEPFNPPCTATHGPYCTCDWGVSGCSCSDTDHPICTGPPPEIMGCLNGT